MLEIFKIVGYTKHVNIFSKSFISEIQLLPRMVWPISEQVTCTCSINGPSLTLQELQINLQRSVLTKFKSKQLTKSQHGWMYNCIRPISVSRLRQDLWTAAAEILNDYFSNLRFLCGPWWQHYLRSFSDNMHGAKPIWIKNDENAIVPAMRRECQGACVAFWDNVQKN